LVALFLGVCFASYCEASTDFYVDFSRSANGDGSAGNPWKDLSNIGWSAIQAALNNGPVNLYFSSHATWTGTYLTVGANGTSLSNTLSLIGDEKFNTVVSGTAIWQSEISGGRAKLAGNGSSGGTIYVDRIYLTVQGFELDQPIWGGVSIGNTNPTTNIHDVTVRNCLIDTPVHNHGVWFGYAETGCYNIIVTGNTIKNTQNEAVYLGHYSFLGNSITGCVVENNTIIDTGLASGGQGEIDIKPAVSGAIVRHNTLYRTAPNLGGTNCGVVVGADNSQIYGNKFFNAQADSGGGWGMGIYVNADGDGTGNGQGITSCLIYNNVIYANSGPAGISILASTSTSSANVSGVKLWNNTISGNVSAGLKLSASGGRTVTVAEMWNNIFSASSRPEILSTTSAETITTADHNLFYDPSGALITYKGVNKTFAQWQALGFDANGVNADPTFVDNTNSDLSLRDYTLQAGSPAIGMGVPSGFFDDDYSGAIRTAPWDIGAYQFALAPTPTPTPTPTSTPTPTPTPSPTATPTPCRATAPNFVGAKILNAQSIWRSAGFTTNVITNGPPGQRIRSQSLPPGYQGACSTTMISVSD
jgi:hypothetical protein